MWVGVGVCVLLMDNGILCLPTFIFIFLEAGGHVEGTYKNA